MRFLGEATHLAVVVCAELHTLTRTLHCPPLQVKLGRCEYDYVEVRMQLYPAAAAQCTYTSPHNHMS
jgi:hypothetical protein